MYSCIEISCIIVSKSFEHLRLENVGMESRSVSLKERVKSFEPQGGVKKFKCCTRKAVSHGGCETNLPGCYIFL